MNPEQIGQIEVKYEEPLIAGQLVTVVFEYTVGSEGLPENGRLRIGLPNLGWAEPEVPQYYFWSEFAKGKERRYTDYDRINTTAQFRSDTPAVPLLEAEARFRKPWSYPPTWLRDYDRFWITVTTEDAPLRAGDKIIVIYGDPGQLPWTARVQKFPEKRICFLAYVDLRNNGEFHEVPGSPWFARVHSGPPSRVQVIVPSIIGTEQKPWIRLAYTDDVQASPSPLPRVGRVELRSEGDHLVSKVVEVNRKLDFLRMEVPELAESEKSDQAIRVTVCDLELEWMACSNPSLKRPDGLRLFWGDLHAQSQYHGWNPKEEAGIGANTPLECYRYARNIAGLDFCAVTDTQSITKEIWADTVSAAQNMYEAGSFVTFQGTELGDSRNGHRNVLFSGDEPERPIHADTPDERGDNVEEAMTPNLHRRFADRRDVILIPHHTKMWLSWDCYHPELEPVLEIHSIWGSGEKVGTDHWELREMTGGAQEAWARGYRIGVIAGSDTHAGLPGRSLPAADREDFLCHRPGYAAVWAKELTRQGIFEALRARRCYGTTGVRIIVETFIEGHPMGSEITWADPARHRELQINVWGTGELDQITVVKNNRDVHSFSVRSDQAEVVWCDRTPAVDGDYYYIRVVQRDDNRAWTSPIWIQTH